MQAEEKVQLFKERLDKIQQEIGRVIAGQHNVIKEVMICLVAGGHVLLEGVPGLGKTLLVKTMSSVLDLAFSRIQFTPDLMPADITGTNLVVEREAGRRQFEFQRGPVFANLVLADEINRATPKTQSALLEAMQEHSVTVSGNHYKLQEPFMVLATQNPIEMEGTYPLPEAQLDRFFFKTLVSFPSLEDIKVILTRTTGSDTTILNKTTDAAGISEMRNLALDVLAASPVMDYISRLLLATHSDSKFASAAAKQYVRYGASPRGGQALVLGAKVNALMDGRYNVSFEDVKAVAHSALRHRLILSFEAQAEGIEADTILSKILEEVPHEVQIATGI
jgi:MoxR-like ATPase